jgi:hypothetical protein
MGLETPFQDFLRSGLYLRGWSARTTVIDQRAFNSIKRFQENLRELTVPAPGTLTKARLEAWVVSMRQKGTSAACCNIYIRLRA